MIRRFLFWLTWKPPEMTRSYSAAEADLFNQLYTTALARFLSK